MDKDVIGRIYEIFPEASLGEDNEGQLIIYTNVYGAE